MTKHKKIVIKETHLIDMADALRNKLNNTNKYKARDIASAIQSINANKVVEEKQNSNTITGSLIVRGSEHQQIDYQLKPTVKTRNNDFTITYKIDVKLSSDDGYEAGEPVIINNNNNIEVSCTPAKEIVSPYDYPVLTYGEGKSVASRLKYDEFCVRNVNPWREAQISSTTFNNAKFISVQGKNVQFYYGRNPVIIQPLNNDYLDCLSRTLIDAKYAYYDLRKLDMNAIPEEQRFLTIYKAMLILSNEQALNIKKINLHAQAETTVYVPADTVEYVKSIENIFNIATVKTHEDLKSEQPDLAKYI